MGGLWFVGLGVGHPGVGHAVGQARYPGVGHAVGQARYLGVCQPSSFSSLGRGPIQEARESAGGR